MSAPSTPITSRKMDPRNNEILNSSSDQVNEPCQGCDSARRKYSNHRQLSSTLANTVCKIMFFTLTVFSLLTNPIATGLGLLFGLVFAKEIKPSIDKAIMSCKKSFNKSNCMVKVLIVAGIAFTALVTPPLLLGAGIGVKAGSDAGEMLSERA